jgi:hypothetical protein
MLSVYGPVKVSVEALLNYDFTICLLDLGGTPCLPAGKLSGSPNACLPQAGRKVQIRLGRVLSILLSRSDKWATILELFRDYYLKSVFSSKFY